MLRYVLVVVSAEILAYVLLWRIGLELPLPDCSMRFYGSFLIYGFLVITIFSVIQCFFTDIKDNQKKL